MKFDVFDELQPRRPGLKGDETPLFHNVLERLVSFPRGYDGLAIAG